jgi:hypothetical protein
MVALSNFYNRPVKASGMRSAIKAELRTTLLALEGRTTDNLSFLFTNLFNGARSSKTENKEDLKAILIYIRGEVSSAEKYETSIPNQLRPISIVNRLRVFRKENWGSIHGRGTDILFFIAFRPALGPTQPPVQRVPRNFPSGRKSWSVKLAIQLL